MGEVRDEPHPKDFNADAELPNGIKIEYTGLRPGEKLYKELLIEDAEKKTKYESITIGGVTKVNCKEFESNAGNLIDFAYDGNVSAAILILKKLVSEYNPQNDVYKTVLKEGEGRNRKKQEETGRNRKREATLIVICH